MDMTFFLLVEGVSPRIGMEVAEDIGLGRASK